MSQRVLVTGHQGYLGTVMVPVLCAAGHQVVGLDNGYFADCVLGPAPDDPPAMPMDLRDVTVEALRGFDAVVHLAPCPTIRSGRSSPSSPSRSTPRVGAAGPVGQEAGVSRFLYASTCSVYGAAGDGLVTEDAELHPITPYAISKVRVEDDVAGMRLRFIPVFLRNATAFASRRGCVPNRAEQSGRSRGAVRRGAGAVRRHPVAALGHAVDIARAFTVCLEAPGETIRAGPTTSERKPTT